VKHGGGLTGLFVISDMVVVLDTKHFREFCMGSRLGATLLSRIDSSQANLFTCIIVAEESLGGWIAQTRKHGSEQINAYDRLHLCIDSLSNLAILPFDADAALIFQQLAQTHPRIGRMDLKIAAICIAHDALLLSRNLIDFDQVAGLRVENWLD
jgi:tRNA(fMet)-specific endonuclease VapC